MPASEKTMMGDKVTLLRSTAAGSPLWFRVSGQCMEPLVPDGAKVRIGTRRVYWPGDIVAVTGRGGALYLHRVLGYRRRGRRFEIITQADRATRNDVPAPHNSVLGKIMGGDCSPLALSPPLSHRFVALYRFAEIACRKISIERTKSPQQRGLG